LDTVSIEGAPLLPADLAQGPPEVLISGEFH
jgi:hypothetical protein